MKVGMLTSVTLLTGALIAFTVAISGFWIFQRINPALEEKELEALESTARTTSLRFAFVLDVLRTDLAELAATPPLAGLVRISNGSDPLDGSTEEQWKARLTTIMAGIMKAKPNYLQVRLIGAADGGRELIRLNRTEDGGIEVVRSDGLQRKGRKSYFLAGIGLPQGEIGLSRIDLNREHGQIEEPHKPVVRAFTPVPMPNDGVYGILIINVDLSRVFRELSADLDDGQHLFIADERGDFLLHPDSSLAYGSELGHDARLQTQFPQFAGFLERTSEASTVRAATDEIVAAAARIPLDSERPDDRYVVFVRTARRLHALAASIQARREGLLVAGIVILFCTLCVAAMGRRVMNRIGAEPSVIEELAARVADGDLGADVGRPRGKAGSIYHSFQHMVGSLRERTERLEESEARSRAIVDTAVAAIITIDAEGKIEQFNAGAESIFGYEASEMLGKNVSCLMPEPDHSRHGSYLSSYLNGGGSKIIGIGRDVEGLRKDGSKVPLRLEVGEAQVRSRRVFVGILYDVSEARAASEKLRESNQALAEQNLVRERVERIADLSRGIWNLGVFAERVVAELARFVGAGAAAFYTRSGEVIGEPGELVLSGSYGRSKAAEPVEGVPGLVQQCADERRAILLDAVPPDYVPIESGLGRAAPMQLLLVPVVFADELRGVIELASFEAFDSAARDLLEQVVPSLGGVVAAIVDRSRIEGLLHEAQRLQEEAQTQSEELQLSNEELARKSATLEDQRAQLEVQAEELRVANEEEEQRAEELRCANEALTCEKAELEAARAALESNSQALERASRYKSEFLANMSHELRTPLNSLLILAKSLATNGTGNLTEDQVQCAEVIHEAGRDLLTLINDILDLSKVEAGRLDVVPVAVSTRKIADAMLRQFRATAEQKALELRVEVDAGVPDEIVTDVVRVEQILRNLLSNACKFTSEGSVTLRVYPPEPGDAPLGGNACAVAFAVEDTGMGISPEKLGDVFEAFQQGDGSTSRRFGGTGLGLTISRELSSLLGGELHVRSEVGRGSCFTLFLPVAGPPVAEQAVEPAPVEEIDAPIVNPDESAEPQQLLADDRDSLEKGDKVVIVVEDDLHFAEILMDRARLHGFKCIAVATGRDALVAASKWSPTAVILDLGLPDMDGRSVVQSLRTNSSTVNVPVHVISARDDAPLPGGPSEIRFTRKPVEQDAVDAILAELASPGESPVGRVLVVEDAELDRRTIAELLADRDVETVEAADGAAAAELLRSQRFDCVILDYQLGDTTADALLDEVGRDGGVRLPPAVIYTARDLTEEEYVRLRSHVHTVVVKGPDATDRLLDEVALFLHDVDRSLPEASRGAAVPSPDASLAGTKILVVDDDLRNTFALSRALRAEGIEVAIADNGEMALEKLESDPEIALVVMDVMMPVMDGLEATRRIRARKEWARIPIIALTAGVMPQQRVESFEAGVDAHLTKPVDMDQLLANIRLWLSRS